MPTQLCSCGKGWVNVRIDIIIAGVGGQGIISIATVIGRAAMERGLHLKQSEVRGMAQRGGAVQTHLRLADGVIHSDIIPQGMAGLIIAMEPMEALRYLPWLAADGWLVSNTTPVDTISNYPSIDHVAAEIRKIRRHVLFDATAIACEKGSARSVNMAMLGAATPFIGLPADEVERAIEAHFIRKGAGVAAANRAVFAAAYALGEQARTQTR